MMTREDCILLGTISKTRGIRGEVIVRIKNPNIEPAENWESLFLQIDGILVPFFILSVIAINADEWIISFEDYEHMDMVRRFIGSHVWIRKDLVETFRDEVLLDALEGYLLTNVRTGKAGVITGFVDIPGNPIFEVSIQGEKLMIPAQDELVEDIDQENKRLFMNLPEGMM
jgi:16S rRNA processing protein RimM